MISWHTEQRKQIRKADQLAHRHNRPFYVLAEGTKRIFTFDSADRIPDREAATLLVCAVVSPDGTMRSGGRREASALVYDNPPRRLIPMLREMNPELCERLPPA